MFEKQPPVCCNNILMFSQLQREANWSVRVWLEKRKEVWVALHTFCKLLKTVVEPASVKSTVNLEFTLLFLSKFTSRFSLTSSPLQCGLYIKQMSPTHTSRGAQNSTLNKGSSAWPIHARERRGVEQKGPCASLHFI